jgi:uncharacterized protein (TIGR02265 family)
MHESAWAPRLMWATPEDTVRGLFLRGTLTAIRALGDESLRAHCAAVCGQSTFFDYFNYPLRVLLQMLATAAPSLVARHGGGEHTLWLLGNCVAMDFLESDAGRILRVLVRGETKRWVNHLSSAYQVALGGERSVRWVGPQRCRLMMRRDFLPSSFHEGFLVGLLDPTDAHRLQVEGYSTGPLESEYDISWR